VKQRKSILGSAPCESGEGGSGRGATGETSAGQLARRREEEEGREKL